MSDPFIKYERVDSWIKLLKQLILINKIDHFHIHENGCKLHVIKDDKTYHINFISEENIRKITRDLIIENLTNDL